MKKTYYLILAAFGIITCNQEAPFTSLYYSKEKIANISLSIAFLFMLKVIVILAISQLAISQSIELNEEIFSISDIAVIALVGFPFTILGSIVVIKIPEAKKEKILTKVIRLIVVLTLLSLILKLCLSTYL